MKKQIKSVILMTFAALAVVGCGPKSDIPGFKKTDTGLHYKFIEQNAKGEQVQQGDVLVAEAIVRFNEDTIFANIGKPERLFCAMEGTFDGDLAEGLLMLHKGDKAVFAVDADKMAEYFNGKMPPSYQKGQGHQMYYEINVVDIVTAAEIQEEQDNFYKNMEEAQAKEPELIANYVKENSITVAPDENGVYMVIRKKGNGPNVAAGKTVAMHYTGRLLDGTVFDSSEGREPLTYVVGQMSLIPGWEKSVMGMPQGTQMTLVIPSAMAYAERGAGNLIPPFSPLVFDVEIVSVK